MGAFRLVLSLLALLFVMACGGIFADIDQEFSENQDDCDDPEELLGQVCGPCDLDTYVCLDGEVQCSGETPCSLDATTLTVEATPEAIHLSWEPVEGATAYRVIRDGVLLIEVTNPSYTDTAADPPGSPGPPQDLEATVDLEEAVILTWDAPLIDDGADHVYQVAPFESGGGGPLSDPVTASRPAPPWSTNSPSTMILRPGWRSRPPTVISLSRSPPTSSPTPS